jgi:RNA polymerase sigma factor (sigma-70 family)
MRAREMAIPGARLRRSPIQQLVANHVALDVTDRELLERFSQQKDELAFEAIVRRHGEMVFAVARRLLANTHDAEDVRQAVFLLLAQKVDSRQWQISIANWLHQTAHNLALKARTSAARRTRREKNSSRQAPADPLAEMTGRELLTVLDEELLALPEPIRAPLVLCYLEGATQDEAAKRLGCPCSTFKKQLERGRNRLHAALVKRGLGFSLTLLGTLATQGRAPAVPVESVRKTVEMARTLAAGGSAEGVISPNVSRLIQGETGMLGLKKLKATLCVVILGGMISLAASLFAESQSVSQLEVAAKQAPKTEPAPTSETVQAPKSDPPPAPAMKDSMKVVVLDPQGKPVSGARIAVSIGTDEKGFKGNRDYKADDDGVVQVELPKSFDLLRLWAQKKPFVSLYAGWEQAELATNTPPAEYTFHLEPATSASGRVFDEQGKPVVGARVEAMLAALPKQVEGDGRACYDYGLATGNDAVTTDSEGRWRIDNLPDHPEAELCLLITHVDFVSDKWERKVKDLGWTMKMLREGTGTVTLKRGVVIGGQVTDPDGRPVKNALVAYGDGSHSRHEPSPFITDADGRYRLPPLLPGTTTLTVFAAGWAPQLRKLEVKPDLAVQDFHLAKGKPIKLRILDSSGKLVSKADISPWWKSGESIGPGRYTDNTKLLETGIPLQAGVDGIWEWPSAPDEPVKIRIWANGFLSTDLEAAGGASERTVTLKANHRITGTVTDAVTGKPIPAFTVIPVNVFRKDFLGASRGDSFAGKDGKLEYLATRTDIPLRLRVEAMGYRNQDGPEFRMGEEGNRIQDFRLQPSKPLTGIVLDTEGHPAAKVTVLLATATEHVELFDGVDHNHRTFTDEYGQFTFPDPGEPWAVIAESKDGTASAEFAADQHDAGTLKLQPWGSVAGKFSDGSKPVHGATILLAPIRLESWGGPRIQNTQQVKTGLDGSFKFSRVSPGPISVNVHIGPWKDEGFRSGPTVPFELKPGGRVDLDLGSGGALLTGKVKLTGNVPADLNCTYSLNFLVRREPGITPPTNIAVLGFDVRKGWQDTWLQSLEGLSYLKTLNTWFVKLAPDGSFRVSGVPAGEYELVVAVYAKPSGCLVDPLARQIVRVNVTAAEVSRGEMKVPEIAAEVVPVLDVGDTPKINFEQVDGKPGTLETVRGKFAIVHFWASWCVPCKKQMPELRKMLERFADRGINALGLSLDDDPASWRATAKGLELPWVQGRVGAKGVPGVSAVPTYWLLDAKGKILVKANDLEELTKEIEKRVKE